MNLFFFTVKYYFGEHMYNIFIIHSYIGKYLVFFHFIVIVNRAIGYFILISRMPEPVCIFTSSEQGLLFPHSLASMHCLFCVDLSHSDLVEMKSHSCFNYIVLTDKDDQPFLRYFLAIFIS